jgi:hypothetical protein
LLLISFLTSLISLPSFRTIGKKSINKKREKRKKKHTNKGICNGLCLLEGFERSEWGKHKWFGRISLVHSNSLTIILCSFL